MRREEAGMRVSQQQRTTLQAVMARHAEDGTASVVLPRVLIASLLADLNDRERDAEYMAWRLGPHGLAVAKMLADEPEARGPAFTPPTEDGNWGDLEIIVPAMLFEIARATKPAIDQGARMTGIVLTGVFEVNDEAGAMSALRFQGTADKGRALLAAAEALMLKART